MGRPPHRADSTLAVSGAAVVRCPRRAQPREFYDDTDVLNRLPSGSDVHFFDAGHFWPFEAVKETVEVITELV